MRRHGGHDPAPATGRRVRAGVSLAAIVVGLVILPVVAFIAAKSRPAHAPPPAQHAHTRPATQTAPAVSI